MAETKSDAPGEERRSVWAQTRTAIRMGLGLPVLGIGAYVLLGLLDGILYPVWLARMNEQIPSAQRATVLSLQPMGVSALMSIAFPAASYLHPVTRIDLITGSVGTPLAVMWLFARVHRAASTTTNVSP